MKLSAKHLFATLLATSTLAIGSAYAADSLTVKGSTSVGPVVKDMVGKFASANKIPVNVSLGGSGEGIKCAKEKTCSIGMSSKAVTGADAEGVDPHHFGWDGLAFVVNAKNGVTNLTKDQIAGIYGGKVKNWKEVGGADAPIEPFYRAESYGEADFFKHAFKIDKPAGAELGANDQVVVKASQNANFISFMSYGVAHKNLARGLKVVSVDGVEPTEASLKDGKYTLRRELVLLTSKDVKDEKRDLLLKHLMDGRAESFPNYGFLAD